MSPDSSLGRFVWYDLMTTDVDAAKTFYTEVTGWTTTPAETPGGPYEMWTADRPVGGVMVLPENLAASGAPPHWIGYIGTPGVDATVERAAALGAEVLHPGEDIPGVGRFAVLRDPQGAVFCLFRIDGWRAPEGPPGDGHMTWHELATTDGKAAWEFYSGTFGWKLVHDMEMGEGAIFRMFGVSSEVPMGGMFDKAPEMPQPGWLHYIHVADIGVAVDAAKDLGGKVVNGPMEIPGGEFVAHCFDPQGAAFALHSGTWSGR